MSIEGLGIVLKCRCCGSEKTIPLDRHIAYKAGMSLRLSPCACCEEPRRERKRNVEFAWPYEKINDVLDSLNMLRRSLEVLTEGLPNCSARLVAPSTPAPPAPRRRRKAKA